MRRNIVTTHIGSFHLAMILVNREMSKFILVGISLLLGLALLCSCDKANHGDLSLSTSTSLIDYYCESNCLNNHPPINTYVVHIEVEPTGGDSQIFYNIFPSSLSKNPIILKRTHHLNGRAIVLDLSSDSQFMGNTEQEHFFDIIAIPSINRSRFLLPHAPTTTSRLASDLTFELDLLDGLTYTLIFNPDGLLNQSPIFFNTQVVNEAIEIDLVKDYPAKEIIGQMTFDDAHHLGPDGMPIMSVKVMQGMRLVSSVANTDHRGRFVLKIANPLFSSIDNNPLNLIIEPMEPESTLPTVTKRLTLKDIKENSDLGSINLGRLSKPLSISLKVMGEDGSKVAEATVYLRGKIGLGESLIRKQSNSSGVIEIEGLFPGEYEAGIIPPKNSPFAMAAKESVTIDMDQGRELYFVLPFRKAMLAHVQKSGGIAISDAQMELLRIGETGNIATEDIYEDMMFKLTASTKDDGKLCHRGFGFDTSDENECEALLLDNGRYLAHVIPPAGSKFAHEWITFDFPEQRDLKIELKESLVLFGQVLEPNGATAVNNAYVTVYLAETNLYNQPKIIGHAITDERGLFEALVPPF